MADNNDMMCTYKQCIKAIRYIDDIGFCCNNQDDFHMQLRVKSLNEQISMIAKGLTISSDDELLQANTQMLITAEAIVFAQINNDLIKLNDIISNNLKNNLINLLAIFHTKGLYSELSDCRLDLEYLKDNNIACDEKLLSEDIPDNYVLEETPVGMYTLCVKNQKQLYLHSTQNPYSEALLLANAYYNQSINKGRYGDKKIALYGLGLGYHVSALSQYNDISEIIVFESDINVIKIACRYIGIEAFESGKVKVIYDKTLSRFSEIIREGKYNVIIHRPSMSIIENDNLRQIMGEYYVSSNSMHFQYGNLVGNFNSNIQLMDSNVYDIKQVFKDKVMFLVAGGPSLDEVIDELRYIHKEAQSNVIIVCVGTVYKRLLAANILPDYVVMTDSQSNMTQQIDNVDTKHSSLIYLSTLYKEVPRQWKGQRYIAFQRDFKYAQEYVKEHLKISNHETSKGFDDDKLVLTGGSVATTAFDIGLRFGCKKIIAIGLDLAFYRGKRGAEQTKDLMHINEKDMSITVEAVDGSRIYTSANLNIYRKWIERRIENRSEAEKETELLNASKGANINGMRNIELKGYVF